MHGIEMIVGENTLGAFLEAFLSSTLVMIPCLWVPNCLESLVTTNLSPTSVY